MKVQELYKKYLSGNYNFLIKLKNDSLTSLLNVGAPRNITLSNNKTYNATLSQKGNNSLGKDWWGIYKINILSQSLTFEEFEELYNLLENKVED